MFFGNYKKFIFGSLTVLLIIIHLIAFNVRRKTELNFFEKTVLFISLPVTRVINSTIDKIQSTWNGYVFLVNLKKNNLKLSEDNLKLRGELDRMTEIRAENERLKKLLNFTEQNVDSYITAKIVSTGPSNFYHTLIINRGSEHGVERGMAVLSDEGVVGQVSYSKKGYSAVITLLDPNSAIDAIDQVTRGRGILRGHGFGKLVFKYLPFSEKVETGDRIVSSGMDGIYPKGIAVGEIETVENKKESLFQNVTVKPAVNFLKIEEVLVRLVPAENKIKETEKR